MQATGRSGMGYAAGAVLIMFLVVDAFGFLSAGYSLSDNALWFFLGFMTASTAFLSGIYRPHKAS